MDEQWWVQQLEASQKECHDLRTTLLEVIRILARKSGGTVPDNVVEKVNGTEAEPAAAPSPPSGAPQYKPGDLMSLKEIARYTTYADATISVYGRKGLLGEPTKNGKNVFYTFENILAFMQKYPKGKAKPGVPGGIVSKKPR